MRLIRGMRGLKFIMVFALASGMFLCTAVMNADAADDPAKQIERKLSKIKRAIATSPSRAEKEWLEAREMLSQLEISDPDHAKIGLLQKNMEQLGKKLEKRLGRSIGGSSPEPKKEKSVQKQKAAPTGLPSSVTSRFRKIGSALDAVEAALAKNQLQSATTKLKTANKLMDEINTRYSKKIPAGSEEMKAVTNRLAAVTGKFNQAEASAAQMAQADAAKREQKEAQSKEWIDKFSPFKDPNSESYLRIGADFNNASEAEQEKCRQAYARANALMAVYQKTEFPNGKTQELLFMEPGLLNNLRHFNESETKERQREASKEWVQTLRAYVDSGAGSRKRLIAGVTADEGEIKAQEALFKEAQTVWSDYQKAAFPLGKTPQLVQLEKDMQERLAQMPEVLRKSRALLAGDLEGELDRILAHLNRDTGWKNDTSKTPNIVMKRDMDSMNTALKRYAGTVDAADPKLAALNEKITRIEKSDQQNRSIRAERTFMEPDRYKGGDADALRKKINDIVLEKSSKVLRITLGAEDWKEEEVLEWTDTTRTKARYRITKSMAVQAAAKGEDGKVYLHGVHLAMDRKSDGSWGPLYGHIMWSDWMAEGNVNK